LVIYFLTKQRQTSELPSL